MLVLISLIAALFQQDPQTGTLEGTVVHRGTNFPIAGVQIKATSDSPTPLETVTDGTGRFVLPEVPAGRVAIEVRADGYMFPQRVAGDLVAANSLRTTDGYIFPNPFFRVTVDLAAGQILKLPPIPASAASAISGRLTDGEGHGIPDADLAFIRDITDAMGRPQLRTVISTTRTDEKGEYRRDMLSSGDYYVKASIDRPDAATLTVYYPATTDARTAAPVVLGEGTEATANIEIGKALEGTFRISGRVPPLKGKSASSVGILLKTQGSPTTSVANTATDEKTGSFELLGIYPGSYDLFASANIGDREYLTKVPIEIRSRDVEEVEIVLRPGADVKGRLIIEGDSNDLQLARPGAGTIRIALNRKDRLFGDILKPVIDASGAAFTFQNVPPGEYDITVRFVADSPDLYVADVRAGGRSVFDSGFEVGTDPTDAMEVVVGTDGGRIAGTILGATSKERATVIVAPEFSRRRNTSLFRAVAGNEDGQFQLRGLTPGTYKIFAVANGTPLSSREEVLSQYESRAVTVVVQKGVSTSGIQVPLLSPVK
jgi:Carboxypeptidase regulatory-like domain